MRRHVAVRWRTHAACVSKARSGADGMLPPVLPCRAAAHLCRRLHSTMSSPTAAKVRSFFAASARMEPRSCKQQTHHQPAAVRTVFAARTATRHIQRMFAAVKRWLLTQSCKKPFKPSRVPRTDLRPHKHQRKLAAVVNLQMSRNMIIRRRA